MKPKMAALACLHLYFSSSAVGEKCSVNKSRCSSSVSSHQKEKMKENPDELNSGCEMKKVPTHSSCSSGKNITGPSSIYLLTCACTNKSRLFSSFLLVLVNNQAPSCCLVTSYFTDDASCGAFTKVKMYPS